MTNIRQSGRLLSVALCLTFLSVGCSLEDPRDACCAGGNRMVYSYKPYGTEAFDQYIHSMRHFLYSRDTGQFIEELPAGEDLRFQNLVLPTGDYTMVSLGNVTHLTTVNPQKDENIKMLECEVDNMFGNQSDILGDSDELYWGVRSFSIDDNGFLTESGSLRQGGVNRELVTYMNNIHCHLNIRIEWANIPEYIGDYEIELESVHARYFLNPEYKNEVGEFIVPKSYDLRGYRRKVPMIAHNLEAEIVTFRLTDSSIPILRLKFQDRQIGPDIDLQRAFHIWGWHPSDVHVQQYDIRIRIFGDGSIEVSPVIEASVDDWIDGGNFG